MQNFKEGTRILETVQKFLKEEKKKEAIEYIYKVASFFQNNAPLSAQKAHIIGCAWFELNDEELGIKNAKIWFSRAIEIDHNLQFSRYYLGVLYFWEKSYEKVVEVCNDIPPGYFVKNYEQVWRDLNVRMYLACAKSVLGKWELDELIEICRIFRDDKSMNLDYPDDLVKFSIDNISTAIPRNFLEAVADMIENNEEYSRWYTGELELIKKNLEI